MAAAQDLRVQKKREVADKDETTIPARLFVPTADIYETENELKILLEMPGIEKDKVEIGIEENVLRIKGQLDLSKYAGLRPLYTEYNVGHYARSFQLSSTIDQSKIAADLSDGLLTLTLPKLEKARPRTIKLT